MNRDEALRIEAHPDAAALADAAAALTAEALSGPGPLSFAATGGSTPAPVYRRLGASPLDWGRIAVTLTDERWVRPGSPDSNETMVRESLLGGTGAARFTPLWSTAATPEAAAEAVEPALRALLPFSAVLLGMGDDGHVASLFPGSPVLKQGLDPDGERLCIGVPAGSPAPSLPRISLTARALVDARMVLVLITGEAKRRTLEAAIEGQPFPVGAVLRQRRAPVRVLWSP